MLVSSRPPEVHVRTRHELESAGYTRRQIDALLQEGRMFRLAPGLYGSPLTPPHITQALRRNHRVTCINALKLYGFWVPPTSSRHEARLRGGRRSGDTLGLPEVVLHDPPLRNWPDPHPVLPLPIAVEHALHCLDDDGAAIVLESGLHESLLSDADVVDAMSALSARRRDGILPLRHDAQSGTETKVTRYLRKRGVRVRTQVEIPGIGRVDLLAGERLIIECDSVLRHSSPEQVNTDRARNLEAAHLGYAVLRLSYPQIMVTWDQTSQTLLDMIRADEHRAPRPLRSVVVPGSPLRRPA
ncbi:MAG: endonuclease domain-containing protein [Brachybacterium sp.]